jgi:hypothetical protein
MQTKRELPKKRVRRYKELHLTMNDKTQSQLQEITQAEQVNKSELFRNLIDHYYHYVFKKDEK